MNSIEEIIKKAKEHEEEVQEIIRKAEAQEEYQKQMKKKEAKAQKKLDDEFER